MARPLMREGVRMVGVDISTEMMGQLRAQLTAEHTPPELLLGDATALPFRDGAFRAAMVVHVLHLVRSVTETVGEIKRVLATGGVLMHQARRPDEETNRMWRDHDAFWREVCRSHGHKLTLRPSPEEITQALTASGGKVTVTELARSDHKSSVGEELENLRVRKHSWMWLIPDAIIEVSMGKFEAWLRERAEADGTFVDRATYVIETWRWA
jgi:ubiquinone/menaquinone biosynthesis C-methylase UbiE